MPPMVHTYDDAQFYVGASADDDALLEVFAAACAARRVIRVYGVSLAHMLRVQALADSHGYASGWRVAPYIGAADLTLLHPSKFAPSQMPAAGCGPVGQAASDQGEPSPHPQGGEGNHRIYDPSSTAVLAPLSSKVPS